MRTSLAFLSIALLLACAPPLPTADNSAPERVPATALRGDESVNRGSSQGLRRNREFGPARCIAGANL